MALSKQELYDFIRARPLAVLATVSASGAPEAALVGIAATPDLELVVDTLDATRKFPNLLRNPRIAFVIGWDTEETLQCGGIADQPEGEALEKVRPEVMEAVRRAFRPEFLNRLDEIILFRRLQRGDMASIVEIQLQHLRKLLEDRKIGLDLDRGALEWLAGKGLGLSAGCAPDAVLGSLPLVYPFIVNDPGEGTQAKRRAHATIIAHLTPPMARADSYGDLARLEQLLDEYATVSALDPAKLPAVRAQVWELVRSAELHHDLQVGSEPGAAEFDDFVLHVDGYLCEVKDAVIRDGLHVLGSPPHGEQQAATVLAVLRAAQVWGGRRALPGLRAALAVHFGLDEAGLLAEPGAAAARPTGLAAAAGRPDRPAPTRADAGGLVRAGAAPAGLGWWPGGARGRPPRPPDGRPGAAGAGRAAARDRRFAARADPPDGRGDRRRPRRRSTTARPPPARRAAESARRR